MKKIMSLALIIFLLFVFCTVALCEDYKEGSFEPLFTGMMGKTQSEWFVTSDSRALLSVMIITDLEVHLEHTTFSAGDYLQRDSYVGKEENFIAIYYQGLEDSLLITYSPHTNKALYAFSEVTDSAVIKYSLESCCDRVYENEQEDLKEMIEGLTEILT